MSHLGWSRIPRYWLDLWTGVRNNLNFYRIHILFFTFTPLIFSGIFYGSNGRYHISYIDALFNCVSAMTVCGLTTVNLSSLTPWQQTILFIQMCLGSPVAVSWVIVYIRRYFFAKKFDYIIKAEAARRASLRLETQYNRDSSIASGANVQRPSRFSSIFRTRLSAVPEDTASDDRESPSHQKERDGAGKKLRPDMIRRMDSPPKLVNPSGWISEGKSVPMKRLSVHSVGRGNNYSQCQCETQPGSTLQIPYVQSPTSSVSLDLQPEQELINVQVDDVDPNAEPLQTRHVSDLGAPARGVPAQSGSTSHISSTPHTESQTYNQEPPAASPVDMPHTTTVEFARDVSRKSSTLTTISNRGHRGHYSPSHSEFYLTQGIEELDRPPVRSSRPPHTRIPVATHPTAQTQRSATSRRLSHRQSLSVEPYEWPNHPLQQKDSGFGGFPMPLEILGMISRWMFPGLQKRLQRSVTIPLTTTVTGQGRIPSIGPGVGRTYTFRTLGPGGGRSLSRATGEDAKPVSYISFDAVVGRNSVFHLLTNEQLEELGGVEYRALNALLWIVAGYHLGIQLISFMVIAPYISLPKWHPNFVPPQQFRPVAPVWFSVFQVVSAYTNTGTSLVDQSMVPFQTAYPMIFFMVFCILAGNTAFPIFLRLLIWIITKFVPPKSRINETLHFLLDHPRRCFIYLFPSHQTWFLLTILLILNFTDWFFFIVLDIGNPEISSIPLGTRFVAGLLQGVAVRAAGFGIVTLAALAPAVKVLYVVMMYISVYPIALSVRSTNVYEEQSLGIYKYHDESEDEHTFLNGPRVTVWSRYLAMHARRQLAFDMWWLALALFLLCIIERGNLDNTNQQGWFNIFTIIFELVSAYGTVGLSLGIPTQNFSFSGALHPLSKLIVCLVMLRGRHRGLPVAIDRAVMLPSEFQKSRDDPEHPHEERRSSRRCSADVPLEGQYTDDNGVGPGDGKSKAGGSDETGSINEERSKHVAGRNSEDALTEAAREKA